MSNSRISPFNQIKDGTDLEELTSSDMFGQ
jgi:hypothetical protein